MEMGLGRLKTLALAALILPLAAAGTVSRAHEAAMQPQKMWLACENGKNYPIRPLAVSRENDLVTGYMVNLGHKYSVHLRLVPMGVGYRYAGRGVWFDGERKEAVLNWGTPNAVPCTVEQE